MKKYFHLQDIDEVNLNTLLYFINNINETDTIELILNSGGGNISIGYHILRVLEENKYRITIQASFICSMAFDIFYHYSGNKYISKNASGMVHLEKTPSIDIQQGGIMTDNDKFNYEKMKKSKPFLYPFLNKSELKYYLNGGEIWMDEKRLKKIFKTYKN